MMNKEITSPTRDHTLIPIRDHNPGRDIHYGLMILIELAENYYSDGCDLTCISKKYNFPMYALIPVMKELEKAGLIGYQMDDSDWLFLKKEPHGQWIFEVTSTLKDIYHSKKL